MKHITDKITKEIFYESIHNSFKKLNPKIQIKNTVMFVVYLGAIIITMSWLASFFTKTDESSSYIFTISIILWATCLFSNFAESLSEGKSRAQTEYLKSLKSETKAFKLNSPTLDSQGISVNSGELSYGDYIIVQTGESIPKDGEVVLGTAFVDESPITGESTPIKKDNNDDMSSVTGGSKVISDWLIIKITEKQGESFLDKMILMIETSHRKKTPNEIALEIFLVALTIIFIVVTFVLFSFNNFMSTQLNINHSLSITTVISLLVCLAPTTIGALLSSIGIAGMNKLNEYNILALSGRAVEAAGDVDILLLDKTGTITIGNREAVNIIPINKNSVNEVAYFALLSSLTDSTPEGKSIVKFAETNFKISPPLKLIENSEIINFSAVTGMSGIKIDKVEIRKGSHNSIKNYLLSFSASFPTEAERIVTHISKEGGTPLVLIKNLEVLGIIHLKDIVKKGIKERFCALQRMGIKTIMITGDNPLTAAAIAEEAGVNSFYANSTPELKLQIIKEYQSQGHLVAMTGDGTNDAPALSQADVAVVMNTGTTAAKEAGNMIDLDSSPVKLLEIVKIGKGMLMTRGALTTFSIANDIAKYFAIVPVLFVGIFPELSKLNIMNLNNTRTAIISALLYNAFIIVFLIPVAMKGVVYKEESSENILKKNLILYGGGGVVIPFIVIKFIDFLLGMLGVGI